MRIDIFHHSDDSIRLAQRLDWITTELATIRQNQESIMATLDEVLAAVNDESSQEDSLVALLGQLREQIAGLTSGNLPADVQAKVDAVFTALQSNKTKLAAAVNNTGTKPAPAPAPSPTAAPAASPSTTG